MRSILEITSDLEVLDALLAEVDLSIQRAEGEITPEIQEALQAIDALKAGLSVEFDTKVDNFAGYVRMLETRAAGRTEEAERMKKLAKRDENNAEYLSNLLKGELQHREIKKIETKRFKVSVVDNGGALPLHVSDDIKNCPSKAGPEYAQDVTTTVLLKDKIRAALEAGEKLDWANLGERGTRLSIR
jgi:hypothetical protein